MAVTDQDEDHIVRILLADVAATVGADHEGIVRANAKRLREFERNRRRYFDRVIEDTQQDFHDGYIDTDWPKCPLHARHPLWLHDGAWWCESARVLIAPVGQLAAGSRHQNE